MPVIGDTGCKGRPIKRAITHSFWTFPVITADPKGVVHVAYSWNQSELDRTMMDVRGTPNESQQ